MLTNISKILFCDMKINTYRVCAIFLIINFIYSCKKDDAEPPTISFTNSSGFVSENKLVTIGYIAKIGINAKGNDANITNLIIKMTNETGTFTALDTGLNNSEFYYSKQIIFGVSAFEEWEFTVMDNNRMKATISLTLTKDSTSQFGPIFYLPSVIIGLQNNLDYGHYVSLYSGKTYFEDSAEILQENVYIEAYYGNILPTPLDFVLSSPNESDATLVYSGISTWNTPRNEVRYKEDSVSVSISDFDNAYDDSIILANYTSATTGKRKFKNARPGYVIPFQITAGALNGKRGLIKVIDVYGQQDGKIEIAIKIQQ